MVVVSHVRGVSCKNILYKRGDISSSMTINYIEGGGVKINQCANDEVCSQNNRVVASQVS